jgi:hypothetical protein
LWRVKADNDNAWVPARIDGACLHLYRKKRLCLATFDKKRKDNGGINYDRKRASADRSILLSYADPVGLR